jgi:hypothetical protein
MGSSGQHKEGCLKCVFGVMQIADDPLTYAEDHRTVPAYDRCERGLIPIFDQLIQ